MEDNKSIIPPSDITHEYAEYGVIDRLGNYYMCEYAGHNNLAHLMDSRGMIPEGVDCYNFFEESGWLILTGSMYTECEFCFEFNPEKIEYQKKSIGDGSFTTERVEIHLNFKLSTLQLKSILEYKKAKKQDSLNFNFNNYTIDEFLEECKKRNWIEES